MKILVNGTILLAPLTGIGQYVRHLFNAMDKLENAEIRMFYGLRCEQGTNPPSAASAQAAQQGYALAKRFLPRPRSIKKLAERALFRHHTRRGSGNELYHEPNFIPLPYDGPVVVTIHDMSCFDCPQSHPAERVQLMQRELPAAIEKADHIVVVSSATGEALSKWFNVDSKRITVIHHAADPRFQPAAYDTLKPALTRLGLEPGGYVLSLGTLEPRKNLITLFAAYAALPTALRQRYPLAVAGAKGWHTHGLLKSATELVQRGELRLLGYVTDDLIPPLYAGAAAFCYPSRYEGFGLPVLEAMASGVPVITSNTTSLPEVVGDAGLTVNPDDVDGLREHLQQLLEDQTYANHLGQRGLVRSRLFSWDRCAKETFNVYEKVMFARGYKL